jgi:ribosome-associated protein
MMCAMSDRDERRRATRDAGERSSRIARELMGWSDTALEKLEMPDDLRAELVTARAIKSPIARRRAERTVAGELRHVDLDELEAYMINITAKGSADTRLFHAAEQWRTRLIAGDHEDFPGGHTDELRVLVEKARRERDTGKPPGAARALFRHVMEVLKANAT